jgi:hypothetical protein
MSFLKKQFKNILLVITLVLLYFNFFDWQKGWLGIVLFLSYFYFLSPFWKDILHRLFGHERRTQMLTVFSWFSIFLLLSFFSGIFLVFYKLTSIIIFSAYVLTVITSVIIWLLVGKKRYRIDNLEPVYDLKSTVVFKMNFWLLVLYFGLWLVAFIILYRTIGTEAYYSPWQVISKYYLPIFFGLNLLSGLLLFFKYKTKLILLIFVLQAILLHFYLPLSHTLPWGGDVWRHIAVEDRLLSGGQVLPVLIGDNAKWVEKIGIDIPEVFVSPHQYNYSQLWGSSVLLAKTFSINLVVINKWLLPILWSIVGTFILYRIGWLLFGHKRYGLWLVWLSFIPFSFQTLGSLTLPVSLGYLTWFFVLMLWLEYLQSNYKKQRRLVYFFGLTMLFGYVLHFVLLWMVIFISRLFKVVNKKIYGWGRGLSKIILSVIGILFIPALEIIFKFSNFSSVDWWNNIKQFVGQITGWFYASLIRPHDILSGNIIFNHTPNYAFVSNIFTDWRWLTIIFMFLFIFSLGFFLWKNLIKNNYNNSFLLLSWLALVLGGSYFISWFILSGDRSLVRRFDLGLAFIFIISMVYLMSFIFSKLNLYNILGKISLIVFLILFSWFGTMTYASGPDMRVVSQTEYEVAQYIWTTGYNEAETKNQKYCVLADTWVLLPLESLSQGNIVGGGFPIDYQFNQVDRVELFNKFLENPEKKDLEKAFSLTEAENCWYLEKLENLKEENIDRLTEIFVSQPKEIAGFAIWNIEIEK